MGRKMTGWLFFTLALLLMSGCAEVFSGILMEKKFEDGSSDRLRIEGLDVEAKKSWQQKSTKRHDEMGVVLKKELTF